MNNRGWGLSAMLGFCCFLGICLLTSVHYYNKEINNYSKSNNKVEYKVGYKMENKYNSIIPNSIGK